MTIQIPITVAYGDGIGPEIMKATLDIMQAAQCSIAPEFIEVGEKIYRQGFTCGIPDHAWLSLKRTKILLKGPITTPQGGGYKSLNVTLRKTMSLFANVRPCVAYSPFVKTNAPTMDLVIVRENEEDTYAGIEHRQTEEVYQCLKLITRPGCEHIIHYAFEYARKFNRKKVTCLSKDNIMKMTDGLFHKVFQEIAADYPDIQSEHLIVDIGTALIACHPERFDVIVTENLYGDIISDVAAQVAGSVGLAGSANIGNQMAMFEAIHGSAPDIAGKDIANPSGLIQAAIQLLIHIREPQTASLIHNAWLKTIEDGIHTKDIFTSTHSTQLVGTQDFARAVITRLGDQPTQFKSVHYPENVFSKIECYGGRPQPKSEKQLVGIDIFIDNPNDFPADELAKKIHRAANNLLKLICITSRGLKIWPDSSIDSPYLRHACCRLQSTKEIEALMPVKPEQLIQLQKNCLAQGLDIIKTENLYTFDGKIGFTLAQGQ